MKILIIRNNKFKIFFDYLFGYLSVTNLIKYNKPLGKAPRNKQINSNK